MADNVLELMGIVGDGRGMCGGSSWFYEYEIMVF
jgi:hypothetical protein